MTIWVVQLWCPANQLRDETILHSLEDARAQRKDFVAWLLKHKLRSARVAQIEVEVPDPDKVLDLMLKEDPLSKYINSYADEEDDF